MADIKFPSEVPSLSPVTNDTVLLTSKDGLINKVTVGQVVAKTAEIVQVDGGSIPAIKGGATPEAAVALPNLGAGTNKYFDASWGYWKYNNVVLTNPNGVQGIPEGSEGILFWNGATQTWSISKVQVIPKGADGKTVEPYNPTKENGYAIGDQIFFNSAIWQATSTAATGQSPDTNPEKWGNKPVFYANSGSKISISTLSLDGYFIKTNGTFNSSDSNFRRSGFIKNEGHVYTFNLNLIPSYVAGVVTFDSNGGYLSAISVPEKTDFRIKFNKNVAYFGLSTNVTSDINHVASAYYIDDNQKVDLDKGKEIYIPFNVVNTYINKQGQEVALSGTNSSPFIDVSSYSYLLVYPKQLDIKTASFIFYDNEQRPILRIISKDLQPQIFNTEALGIKYFRASNLEGAPRVFEMIEVPFVIPFKDLKPDLSNISLIDVNWTNGGSLNANNSIVTQGGFSYSDVIDISAFSKIGLITDRNNTDTAKNLFLNSSGGVVSVIQAERGQITLIDKPIDATHIRLSKLTTNQNVILFHPETVSERTKIDYSFDEISFSTLSSPPITWENGFYYNSDGEKISSPGFKASNKIPLANYTHVVFYSNRKSSDGSKNLFLNSSGGVVSSIDANKGEKSILKIPSGATHIVITDYLAEPIRPILYLARGVQKQSAKLFTLQDIQLLMLQGYFKETPSYSTVSNPRYVNYEDFGMIRPQAVATQAIFLENTVSVPQSGVCLISSEGQLCAVINGVKYLINLTKV